jgi:uncharacterized protein (TIGR04255 family)
LTAASQAHAQVQDLLPQKKAVKGMAFKIDPAASAIQLGSADDLVDYVCLDEAGLPDFTVSIRPDFFSCSSKSYTSWRVTKPQLLKRLLPFVGAALEKQAVMQAIGLQYTDVFRWSKEFGDLVDEVVRRDTPLLPSSIFERKSFWHVHQGWFSSGHRSLRVLNIVNIDFVEQGEDLAIRINGQHKVQARNFDGTPSLLSVDDAIEGLDDLHVVNKEVLSSLLTPATLQRIGMKASTAIAS